MAVIEILGRVDDDGRLQFETPGHLPPGDVRITIEPVDIAADEALWDEQFAKSQDFLEQLSQEAHEDYLAGRVTITTTASLGKGFSNGCHND